MPLTTPRRRRLQAGHRRLGMVIAGVLLLFVMASPLPATAATLTVNSTLDSDDGSCTTLSSSNPALECTLREAINAVNSLAGADTIAFTIPGVGVRTIRPTSALPKIDDVTIDGYTQPGSAPNTLANGDNAVLRIELDGSLASPGASGLWLGARNTVRGLVINRFGDAAMLLQGTLDSFSQEIVAENVIEGNFLGTDVTGALARPNQGGGVIISSAGNRLGGDTPAARNLISGNSGNGVGISATNGTPAWDNAIVGNLIGTNAAGNARLPNLGRGVVMCCGARMNGVSGNVISGNVGHGVIVFNALHAAGNHSISGNKIGTDVGGTLNLGNNGSGVEIQGADYVDVTGNTIAFNGLFGVGVHGSIGVHLRFNSIFSNFELGIELSGGDLGPYGVTTNDSGDLDAGTNYLQNFPIITAAVSGNGTTTVSGRLNSTAQIPFWIEVFSNPSCDLSGHGEGRTLLGRFKVVTDATGNVAFTRTLAAAVPVGFAITATATDANDPVNFEYNPNAPMLAGNTSEFSACLGVAPRLVPEIWLADARIVEGERGLTAVYSVMLSDSSDEIVTVDFMTVDGKAIAEVDYEPQKGALVYEPGETEMTIAVRLLTENATEPEAFAIELANPVNAWIAGTDR